MNRNQLDIVTFNGKHFVMKSAFKSEGKRVESKVISEFSHRHILSVICDKHGVVPYYIVPFMEEGDALSTILTHDQLVLLVAQMIGAITHIHKKKYLHLGIDPEHILKDGDQFYLIGLGRAVKMCNYIDTKKIEESDTRAPEIAEGRVTEAADWFSLGATVYILAAMEDDVSAFAKGIQKRSYPESFPEDLKALLQVLLSSKEEDRTFDTKEKLDKLINLEIFKGIDWKSILDADLFTEKKEAPAVASPLLAKTIKSGVLTLKRTPLMERRKKRVPRKTLEITQAEKALKEALQQPDLEPVSPGSRIDAVLSPPLPQRLVKASLRQCRLCQ